MTATREQVPTLLASTFDPWRYLAEYWPAVRVIKTDHLREGERGRTEWTSGEPAVIRLRSTLDATDARAVLTHEIMHLELGPPPEGDEDADEYTVHRLTSRRLLPDLQAVRVALTVGNLRVAARALNVPERILVCRLRNLSTIEVTELHGSGD